MICSGLDNWKGSLKLLPVVLVEAKKRPSSVMLLERSRRGKNIKQVPKLTPQNDRKTLVYFENSLTALRKNRRYGKVARNHTLDQS